MMKRSVLLVLLSACLSGGAHAAHRPAPKRPAARTVSGMIYFTNNTPKDRSYFVELYGRTKRRLAAKWTRDSGFFEFKGLKPGVYYLQISGPNICLLQYEVNASRRQPGQLTILGDAGCGRHQVAGLPAPRPLPRDEKR